MLIPLDKLPLTKSIRGIIHIGAHECEEHLSYIKHFNLNNEDIIWIEAIQFVIDKVKICNPNIIIYNACISDIDDQVVEFKVTNNIQSSSILELKEHKIKHPNVIEVGRISMSTKTNGYFY